MKKLLMIAAAICVGAFAPRLVSQDQVGGWSTAFAPNTLELAEVKQNDKLTTFVLRNISGKHITAFAIRLSNDTTHSVDSFEAENDFEPGTSNSLTVGKNESSAEHILRLSAVIFRDGTSLGESDVLDGIRGRRLGLSMEIERVAGILSLAANAEDESIEALKTRIGSLPQSSEDAVASVRGVQLPGINIDRIKDAGSSFVHGFHVGVSNAREAALWKVDQLAQFPVVARGRAQPSRDGALLDLRHLYQALSARNQAFLNQRGVIHQ